uniref:Fkbp-rapamycin associated protein n=1 Tax=Solanum tuberosum TaxID=4113 RepID=M1AGY1_SOLTU
MDDPRIDLRAPATTTYQAPMIQGNINNKINMTTHNDTQNLSPVLIEDVDPAAEDSLDYESMEGLNWVTVMMRVEFMEHNDRPLPIDIRLLGALAGKAAIGILTYAQQHLGVQLKESWYEKLQLWDDALKAYTAKVSQASSPHLFLDATLARWEELNNLCKEYWTPAELEMAPMVLESYERAYNKTVHVQQLSELEEVIEYCTLPPMGNLLVEGKRALFPNMWNERIKGA